MAAQNIDLTPQVINVKMEQGTDFVLDLIFTNQDTTALDISTFTFLGEGRKRIGVATPPDFDFVFTKTGANTLRWSLPRSATKDLLLSKDTQFFYDIDMLSASNVGRKIAKGVFTVVPQVTREDV